MALADIETLVDDLVRAEASLVSAAQRGRAIDLALGEYAAVRPRLRAEDAVVAASGDAKYVAIPSDWTAPLSVIVEVEWPIDREPRSLLTLAAVEVGPVGLRVRLTGPSEGDTVRIRYTTTHTLTSQTDTVPAADRQALACCAASILLGQLAAKTAAGGDTSLGGIVSERQTVSQGYAARARELRERFKSLLGIGSRQDAGAAPPAAGSVDFDLRPSHGLGRLTHR